MKICKDDITHIEMYHHQYHYDAIESNKMCKAPPELTGKEDTQIIV